MNTVVCIIISVVASTLAVYLLDKILEGAAGDAFILSCLVGVIIGVPLGWVVGAGNFIYIGRITGMWRIVALISPLLAVVVYFVKLFFYAVDCKEISTTIGAIEWHYHIRGVFPTTVSLVGFKRILPGSEVVVPSRIFGKKVSEIDTKAFMGHDDVKSIEFDALSDLCEIESKAFYGCSNLETIAMPTSLSVIGDGAFQNCSRLEEVDWRAISFDYGHYHIGSKAFAGCSSLETFTVPTVCEVGEGAFENCTSLKSISIPSSLEGKTANWGLPADCSIVVRPIEVNDGNDVGETVDSASDSPELQEAYRLLGVSNADSIEVIRKAYLENLGKASEFLQQNQALAEKMMAEINVAWKTIEEKSATKRA